jgi:FAD/FMN-containing dehydrogenase
VPEFLERGARIVREAAPDARLVAFGHMGDGNIHFNVSQPAGGNPDAFRAYEPVISGAVHALVIELGGSVSAEHGIGRLKRGLLHATKSPVEMEMMRAVKRSLDPRGIMNPGKIV